MAVGNFSFIGATLDDAGDRLPQKSIANEDVFEGVAGDRKKLTMLFYFNGDLDNMRVYFRPGLFVPTGGTIDNPYVKPPAGYEIVIDRRTVLGEWIYAGFLGDATQRNYLVRFLVGSDRHFLSIELDFFMTCDLLEFMSNAKLTNSDRFQKDSINNNDLFLADDSAAIYSGPKNIGWALYVEKETVNDFKISILKPEKQVIITRFDGGDFTDELGNTSTSTDDYSIMEDGFLISIDADISAITANSVTFALNNFHDPGIEPTGVPVAAGPIQIKSRTNNKDVSYDSSGVETAGKAGYVPFSARYYNVGPVSVFDFKFYKGGVEVENLSKETDSTLEFTFTSSIDFDAAKLMQVKGDNISNNTTMFDGHFIKEFDGVLSVVSGNDKKAVFSLNADYFRYADEYYFIVILYDSVDGENQSFISPAVPVDELPEVLAIPDITPTISDLVREYDDTNALEVAPYERFKLKLKIDKSSFNTTLAAGEQSGNFDDNLKGVEMSYGNNKSISIYKDENGELKSSFTPLIKVEANDANTLTVVFFDRALPAWIGQDVSYLWKLKFTSEPKEIRFTQKIRVRDYENNQVSPKILTGILYDLINNQPIYSFYDIAEWVKFKVTTEAELEGGAVIAIVNKNAILERESYVPPVQHITNTNTNGIRAVPNTVSAALEASFELTTVNLDESGEIVLIVKKISEAETPDGIDFMEINDNEDATPDFIVR